VLVGLALSSGLALSARAETAADALSACSALDDARALRAVLAPSAAAPARLAPGEPLWLTVASATGLTPPPGLQEPRAHRGLFVGLCGEGEPLGAPAQLCTPLRVDDFRPCGPHSLVYRVRALPEAWLPPGPYTLRARFPGGDAELPGALELGAAGRRVHVGAHGVVALPEPSEVYPAPGSSGGFGPGYVLVLPAPGPPVIARTRAQPLLFDVAVGAAVVAGRVRVQARGLPAHTRVFVRSELGDFARGADVWLPTGSAPRLALTVLAVAPDGRSGQRALSVAVRPALGFGCGLGPRPAGRGALGLLALALSATLGRRAGQKRRAPTLPTRE
jgi:hypothetical protein